MPDEDLMTETDATEAEETTESQVTEEDGIQVDDAEETTETETETTEEETDGTQEGEETKEGERDAETKEGEEVEYDDDYEIQGTIVVDGKEVEQSVPLRRLWNSYQMEAASQKKFQEASQLNGATNEMLSYFMKNPFGVLKEFYTNQFRGDRARAGQYVDALIDRAGADRLEEASLPEHERQLRDLQNQLQEERVERDRVTNAQEEERLRGETESWRQRHDQAIGKAMQELAGVKDFNTPQAHQLYKAIERKYWELKDYGLEPTALDAAQHAIEERQQFLEGYLQTADPDELMKLKPGIEAQVNKRSLQKVKEQQARRLATAPNVPATDRTGKDSSYSTWDDLEEDAGKF